MENSNNEVLFSDDLDLERPNHAWRTLKRLWATASDQHGRLAVVLISVVFYAFFSVAAP